MRPVKRWQSKRGKYWIQLNEYDTGGFSYRTDNGGGNLGNINEADAIAQVEKRVNDLAKYDGINLKEVPPVDYWEENHE